jgi:hypothetical protein
MYDNVWSNERIDPGSPISFDHTSFDRGPRVDNKPKRISADDFSFGS